MKNTVPINAAPDLEFDTPAAQRLRKIRKFKDKFTTVSVGIGGTSVIVAIMLIFVYLLYEVLPLFHSATIKPYDYQGKPVAAYQMPGSDAATIYTAVEEQNEIAFRLTEDGSYSFFDARTGAVNNEGAVSASSKVSAFAIDTEAGGQFALAHEDGTLSFMKQQYKVTYPNDIRLITPSVIYPYGEDALELNPAIDNISHLAVRDEEDALVAVTANVAGQLALTHFTKDANIITDEIELSSENYALPAVSTDIDKMLLSAGQEWVFIADKQGQISILDIRNRDNPVLHEPVKATSGQILGFNLLLGGNAILVADDTGAVSQWFLVRDDNNDYTLQKIRSFENLAEGSSISQVITEHRRKGFIVANADGQVSFFNTTAHNKVLAEPLAESAVSIAISPRSNGLLVEDSEGKVTFWKVDNEHPDVSMNALWSKVWYEGYQEPEFIWQSSASNNDFEPKYSLMPLAFGTLKAAFYAMLLATPLAIFGAIYTAYFMAPALRRKIKPFIELMEALPTVILGFLAGLWLAPFVETNLATIFTILILVPAGVLLFAFTWQQMPKQIRWLVPDGWDAALLIPVVILLVLFCLPMGEAIEALFFGGDMRSFVSNDLGIPFDQRNALVVGLAMGFAVIPTIFSITEDAVFSVPQHLSNGSLALGASPWQTLSRVVIPTASPGIFSAVMIGMGRAVGETMIVLMATGNTPIMDMNIFEGMRTLAANIAVEMPESEVGSSHFRILFLAALVLFTFTFIVNTAAEVVRQRLRRKYGSL